ncbi:hypothetical protein ANN_05907 [Periplaneta americana]|uniref:Mutator-like transposase domain-containing protein n=1 Tax=Periplaneta americana TaxID=6978 RepID=A0ABQ8TC38_PERAM|nr:hypothetical protein ANN_05907 [Periplaneta americana]
MLEACKEAVQCNDGDDKIPVAIDGTWHKRGHTSNHGVVVATSVDTGKVLDSELLSKYCHTCKKSGAHEGCVKNFDGSSGGMEAEGAVRIFQRSNQTRGVKYKQYLGDGDSKGFVKVVESKPYGDDCTVEKLECIGHVQKRMGSRLRKLKKDLVGKKLSDGKGVGGSKRLTDGMIDKLQNYYGQAIRNNLHSLQDMRSAVWATYFHELSTDDDPQHGLCPKGDNSWCKYNRKEPDYKHHGLPESVMLAIKPIYRDLIPKTVFVSVNTLRLGLTDAIISFNDGNIGRMKVLQKLGIEPGFNTITILKELDSLRIKKAEMVMEEMAKKGRKLKRNKKRSREDTEDSDYGAGMF